MADPLETAFAHFHAGRLGEAEAICRRTLAAQPADPDATHLLGAVAAKAGRKELAVELIRRAIALNPRAEHYRNSLGLALQAQGAREEAIAAYLAAIALKPELAAAHYNMGNALMELGKFEEATAAFRRAVELQPDFVDAHNNLGNSLKEQRKMKEAMTAYEAALRLKPDHFHGHNNLGLVLRELGHMDAAVVALRRAIELVPDDSDVHNNLGNALKDQGFVEEAMACYRRAEELNPQDVATLSNLIFSLQFVPAPIEEECARWNRRHAVPLRPCIQPYPNTREPERRLKVGYVSPDFRGHPVAFFSVPLFAAHDRREVEVFCYSSAKRPDDITAIIHRSADVWREVLALTDAELAAEVRRDGIDILVDLSMHSAEGRLLTFAAKPAPVQVSWLAYPGSTGVETIDYRLTDTFMEPAVPGGDPPGEQPIRLPDAWCCYQPVGRFPEVNELPALSRGYVTFGSLNNLCKVNEAVLVCWAQVLRAVEHSRLLMYCPPGEGRERVRRILEAHGVSGDRLDFEGRRTWADYLGLYRRIDLALDPFPVNGMTTSCHALWMGVPVLTLPGTTPASRAGFGLLSTVGLAEMAADSEESFTQVAVALAGDLPRLAALRATLRERMRGSALMDAPRFARQVETAWREIWRSWCRLA